MKMTRAELIELIDIFISGQDVSISHANRIEVAIDDEFPDNDYMQDVVGILASYRPGGGDYLYDEEFVTNKLQKVRERL